MIAESIAVSALIAETAIVAVYAPRLEDLYVTAILTEANTAQALGIRRTHRAGAELGIAVAIARLQVRAVAAAAAHTTVACALLAPSGAGTRVDTRHAAHFEAVRTLFAAAAELTAGSAALGTPVEVAAAAALAHARMAIDVRRANPPVSCFRNNARDVPNVEEEV